MKPKNPKLKSPNSKNNIPGRALFYCDETRETVQVGGLKITDDNIFAGFLIRESGTKEPQKIRNGKRIPINKFSQMHAFIEGEFSVGDTIWVSLEDGRMAVNNKPSADFLKKHIKTYFKVVKANHDLKQNERENGCPNAVIGYNFGYQVAPLLPDDLSWLYYQ